VLPALARSRIGRSLLLARVSAQPAAVPPGLALEELRGFASTRPMTRLLWQLAYGEPDLGAPPGSLREPLVLGWGREDRICPPAQAQRALAVFPDARLHWFERCGHYPHWDVPEATVRLILESTGSVALAAAAERQRPSDDAAGRDPLAPAR
jgi:pimeloyl-ACP methyl ester carboxylesterase